MASDRGAAAELAPHELDPAWFDCDVLHISGYSLLREPLADAAVARRELARAHGAQRLARRLDVDARRRRVPRAAARSSRPTLVFATEREREALGRARHALGLKRGARRPRRRRRATTRPSPTTVVDTTGAGDALAAGFLVGGAELGLDAAARCCAQLGAMP